MLEMKSSEKFNLEIKTTQKLKISEILLQLAIKNILNVWISLRIPLKNAATFN